MQELFEKYDASGDGVLSEKEMVNLFEHLGIPRAQAEEVFTEADANRDGTIQVHEPFGIENNMSMSSGSCLDYQNVENSKPNLLLRLFV